MKAKLIVFDLDGTILDSIPGIIESFRFALKQKGLREVSANQIKSTIGLPVEKMFTQLFPNKSKKEAREFANAYREYYVAKVVKKTKLYPGAKRTITELKKRGKKLAVATSKRRHITKKILTQRGILCFFDFILCSDDVQKPKPDPEILFTALKKANETAEDSIMVGDTVIDALTAKNAKMRAIGVTFGIASEKELNETGCIATIKKFSGLLELIE